MAFGRAANKPARSGRRPRRRTAGSHSCHARGEDENEDDDDRGGCLGGPMWALPPGKSPRLGYFLLPSSLPCSSVSGLRPLHLVPVCKLLSLLEEAIKNGRGKKPRYPSFLLPASSAGRPSGKVSQSGGEDERKNRRERMNVHNKSLPLPSLIPGGGSSYHHRHQPPDEWKRRGALYFVACARGNDSDIRFLPECRCRG